MSRPYRTIRGVAVLLALQALAGGAAGTQARAQAPQPQSSPWAAASTSPATSPSGSTSSSTAPSASPPPASASQPAGERLLLQGVQASLARLEQAKGLDEKLKAKAKVEILM